MAKMVTTIDIKPCVHTQVRRFSVPDYTKKASWLLPEIQKLFPSVSEKSVYAWISSLTASKEHSFICTDNAVGLGQISHLPLCFTPIVEEVFVYIHPDADFIEGVPIYLAWKMWAEALNSKEIRVENNTHIPREYIEAAFGRRVDRVAYSKITVGR